MRRCISIEHMILSSVLFLLGKYVVVGKFKKKRKKKKKIVDERMQASPLEAN